MTDFKNINLQVAQFALKSVEEVLKEAEKKKEKKEKNVLLDKYKTISKKMTTLIQKNGLIGTLVFILSKTEKEKSHKLILEHIKKWCKEDYRIDFSRNEKLLFQDKNIKNEEFIENISNLSSQEYRLITKEIMMLFGWIKRFADGMIKCEEDSNNE